MKRSRPADSGCTPASPRRPIASSPPTLPITIRSWRRKTPSLPTCRTFSICRWSPPCWPTTACLTGWVGTWAAFAAEGAYHTAHYQSPKSIMSVVNHRALQRQRHRGAGGRRRRRPDPQSVERPARLPRSDTARRRPEQGPCTRASGGPVVVGRQVPLMQASGARAEMVPRRPPIEVQCDRERPAPCRPFSIFPSRQIFLESRSSLVTTPFGGRAGMARLTQADLHEMNQTFEQRTPQELLRWTREVFGTRVAALSAMQKAGSVVCHMLRALQLPMKVLFVDTGVHFTETLVTRDRIASEYNLEVVTLVPALTMERTDGPLRRALPLDRGATAVLPHAEKRAALGRQRAVRRLHRQLAAVGRRPTRENARSWPRPGDELRPRQSAGQLLRQAVGRLHRRHTA